MNEGHPIHERIALADPARCGSASYNDQCDYWGCLKHLVASEAYRCTGCDLYFHRECAKRHFTHFENKYDAAGDGVPEPTGEWRVDYGYAGDGTDRWAFTNDVRAARFTLPGDMANDDIAAIQRALNQALPGDSQ